MGTDFGHCCRIVPQIAFKTPEDLDNLKEVADSMGSGSQTGESNGLALLLDVENYNIGYYKTETQGLKVAVHDYKLVSRSCIWVMLFGSSYWNLLYD